MRYGYIGGLDKPVSRIVLGTTAIDAGDQSRSDALLDAAWEAGITAFDTALVYPNGGEIALGRWLRSRGIIDQAVVITKGAHHDAHRRRVTPEDIQADCRQSIDRLGTGCIDLYLLHRDDPAVPVGEIDDFARRGYFCKENLARLHRCEQLAAAKGTAVATVALAWLMHQMENVFAVAGASRPERAAQLAEATALILSAAEVDWLASGEENASFCSLRGKILQVFSFGNQIGH